jgi:histidinol-phosphate aminotransferase
MNTVDSQSSNAASSAQALVRANIAALKPYASARDEFQGEASIFIDANENSLGSPLEEDFSRYPDPQQWVLKTGLAEIKGVKPAQIFLGNGSDEAIDLLMRAFCEPGHDNIVLLPPTYGMYAVQAGIHGAEIRRAPLTPDFLPDINAINAVANTHSKLLFVCSPNNPTGNCMPEPFVLQMLHDFPGLVVVDEAYADFSERGSLVRLIDEYPNLVVLQTFSKAWGLAGLRVGMAIANEYTIGVLNKIKYPYNLSAINIRLATEALAREGAVREKVKVLLEARAFLETELPKLPCVEKVHPSDANFLLVRTTDADGIYRYLAQQGIIVRNRSREMHCADCLRITVGTPDENVRLLEVLRAYCPPDELR